MVKKRTVEKTPAQVLEDQLRILLEKRIQAHRAGASHLVMNQIEQYIQSVQSQLEDEQVIQDYRNKDSNDGETFIV